MAARPPKRYAVIGNPIAHSRSPSIHADFARQTGVELQYERLLAPLDGFDDTLDRLHAAGGAGANVTVPFKVQAWQRASRHLSPRARLAGAVNTLWWQDGELYGCNTDGIGLVRDLERLEAPLAGASILVLGAGGAARGAIPALIEAGCARVRVANRTESRAVELARLFASETHNATLEAGGFGAAADPTGWDIVINATASSLADELPALPEGVYRPGVLAYDMVYSAQPTAFMREASQHGARTADGLGMLVEQAAESFAIWHGVRPSTAQTIARLRAELAR
ncbi:shikimate dehydrogenase [Verticiella sediminum]|uniref:Shikimate dehydrogenase (NADP(+)) n=1 Tax=Verticiella sediminum TaxID=1247510 RepID=A0A556A8F4_9BURK|nr:shikimate dehydrogenase [Verticiella sediminum]TSH89155.1 shikimate dehydrogenase [Verticiella sediminum]